MKHKEYAETRLAFAIVNGAVVYQPECGKIPTKEWIENVLHEDYATTIRGGMFENRLTLCIGEDYLEVDLTQISAELMLGILQEYYKYYQHSPSCIVNGQFPGEVGTEWSPRRVVYREAE